MTSESSIIQSPHLVDAESFSPFPADCPATQTEYMEVICNDVNWEEAAIAGVTFDSAVFQKAKLARSIMRDTTLRDVSIAKSDLSNADWIGTSWQAVGVFSTRLTGFNGSEGGFRDVTCRGCTAKFALLHSAKCERCVFEKCDLSDATFENASLKSVTFRDCNLTNVRFLWSTLEAVDLRGSNIQGLQIDVQNLRSVTIDPMQTTAIATLTGVTIEGLEES